MRPFSSLASASKIAFIFSDMTISLLLWLRVTGAADPFACTFGAAPGQLRRWPEPPVGITADVAWFSRPGGNLFHLSLQNDVSFLFPNFIS